MSRTLTLADELTRQGHECWFVCREHEGHMGKLIASKGYRLTLLPMLLDCKPYPARNGSDVYASWLGVPWKEDAIQALDSIAPLSPDWLVVDHYALDVEWERMLTNAVGNIMVIDDLANRPHECALLLDQNLGRVATDYDGLVPAGCQRLIGPSFALLRPEFAEIRELSLKRRERPELKRILISLGGVDIANATGQVLEALSKAVVPKDIQLDIIMGASAPHLDEVRQHAALLPCKASVSVNVDDMAERMCMSDLSIGAAGSTSWERCCLGLPTATMILADNQRLIGEALAQSGAAILIQADRIVEDLATLLKRLADSTEHLQTYAKNSAIVCDGGGTSRVASMLTEKCSA